MSFLLVIPGRNSKLTQTTIPSFPNFLERFILKLPLSKLCAVPFALHNRALFEVEKRAKRWREKGKRGAASKGGKKEKRTRENRWDQNTSLGISLCIFQGIHDTEWEQGITQRKTILTESEFLHNTLMKHASNELLTLGQRRYAM